jgi:Xaa-Pro aminopeptidase
VASGTERRIEGVCAVMRERNLDALLVSAPANVRYLTGYTGSHGVALLTVSDESEAHSFFTDFRYETQAQEEVGKAFAIEIAPLDLFGVLVKTLEGNGRLGFDESHLTVRDHTRLDELLDGRFELVCAGGVVEHLREVKDADEVRRIESAARLADEALQRVLEGGLAGRTERELAIELELQMRRLGADAASFPTIVAAGAHAALPHAHPLDVRVGTRELVTIDWGAVYDGYCSDCTRTFASSEPTALQREVYALVLEAQEAGLAALRAGPSGKQVDAAARRLIEDAGHGAHFGHGLGHGVGIEVHEGPRLSRLRADAPLRAGNVVTVEPGVYLAGELGVRIEDLAVVSEDGSRVLSSLPKWLTIAS